MDNDKCICHMCVPEKYIRKYIKKHGFEDEECYYCERKTKTIAISDLAEKFDDVINVYYERSRYNARGESLGEDVESIIISELKVTSEVAEDILEYLIYSYQDYDFDEYGNELASKYDDDPLFSLIKNGDGNLDYKWNEITNSLLTKARFFNSEAKDFLDLLFKDVHKHTTDKNSPIVHSYDTEKILFRARVFDDIDKIGEALVQPEKNLGPPPPNLAKPGRMNAQGISVFYGATSPIIAIAEVRPTVGSYVVTAQFKPLRELKILDISAFKSIRHANGSKFDPKNKKNSNKFYS